jgi:3-hydroxybutyryl-CoA dehydrogenase
MRLAVFGAGVMGHGIAQVAAMSGVTTTVCDVEDRFLERGRGGIAASLERFVKKGDLKEPDMAATLARLQFTTELATAIEGADIVIEAIPEVLSMKQDLFRALDQAAAAETVLASNTTQCSITALASVTKRRQRVVGMHWINPPQMMKLVEIVRGLDTSDETVRKIEDAAKRFNKETVVCRDTTGFITSRMILAWMSEAIRMREEGVATEADIDKAMRLGFGHPMGPFQIMDLSGLDVLLDSLEGMLQSYGERFRPPQLMRNMVRAGYLGRKTSKGFYSYPGTAPR